MKKGIITGPAFKRLSSGHPWLLADDIVDRKILPQRAGAFHLGEHWWLHSPESYVRLRRLGPPLRNWMARDDLTQMSNGDQFIAYFGDWLKRHLVETLKRKIKILNFKSGEDICLRWIFSENDLLPGLIVDVFQETVVCQINSAPIELLWLQLSPMFRDAFQEVTDAPAQIIELRNSSIRAQEGLVIIPPEVSSAKTISWNGFKWSMRPASSQKTGAYFDQRDNHSHTANLAKNLNLKTAWDLCSYEGGFSLHLLKQNLQVLAVDQSKDALAAAQKNVQANDLNLENFSTHLGDIFEFLKTKSEAKEKVDLIVLDPPSFVKTRTEITAALRGYKELNLRALQCLNPGGVLVSCVCSHHITAEVYERTLIETAHDVRRAVKVLGKKGPSADHAPALGFNEGQYLQAWYLQVMD